MTKEPSFSGHFYPSEEKEILRYITHFNTVLKDNLEPNWKEAYSGAKRALISPHAGYIYSGFTANMGYSLLSEQKAKRAIVIGPSHKVAFEGISTLRGYSRYNTPFGYLRVDVEYQNELDKHFNLIFDEKIHMEHSTETQMPFIKHYLDIPIIELIYSQISYEQLSKIIIHILQDSDNLLIVSTDLSHFYKKEEAFIKDSACIEAIKHLDLSKYDNCEACGGTGVRALVKSSTSIDAGINLASHILDYRTSADYSKDESSVVGYLSVLFTNK